jgi:hypothetical protein
MAPRKPPRTSTVDDGPRGPSEPQAAPTSGDESGDRILFNTADNFPGFGYAERVATAAVKAFAFHGQEANRAFSDMRDGNLGVREAIRSWTRVVDSYSAVVMEMFRNPLQLPSPAWFSIPYSKKNPVFIHLARVDQVIANTTELLATKFEAIGVPDPPIDDLIERVAPAGSSRVEIDLNRKALDNVQSGRDYVGLIVRKGAGSAAPLLVVAVHVSD